MFAKQLHILIIISYGISSCLDSQNIMQEYIRYIEY